MPDFKSIAELEKYLKTIVNFCLQTDVAQDIKELIKEHVETDVYAKYQPSQYMRRKENGGLLDDNNYLVKPIKDGVSITNITTDNGYSEEMYGDFGTHPDTWIVPIIETGIGYSWTESRIYKKPFARPFIDNTRNDLFKGLGRQYLKKSLLNHNIKSL